MSDADDLAIDSCAALAERLSAAPPPVAVLAGAGTSSSSGVPTGEDLLRRVACALGQDGVESRAPDLVRWYVETFGVFPNYIRMLQEAGGLGSDAKELPTSHFEQGPTGAVAPSPAHRSIAALAAAGLVGPILTTNFDRLLERALHEAGLQVVVAYDLDTMARATAHRSLLGDQGVLLVKLHGDYRDIRIRDTSCGFATYHPVIESLLGRVLSEFDLLVCGWSGSWDIPLRRALERLAAPERRRTYWLLRGTATAEAAGAIATRRARVIPVASSNAGLTSLWQAVGRSREPRDQSR